MLCKIQERIPYAVPKKASDAKVSLAFFAFGNNKGFERSEQNTPVGCFGTVTEGFCETFHIINSKTLSKNQERIPYAVTLESTLVFVGESKGFERSEQNTPVGCSN